MKSFEAKSRDDEVATELPPTCDYSLIKYLWQVSPYSSFISKDSIPRFLREIRVLKNFTDLELYSLMKYFHVRRFSNHEFIFKQGEIGFGFYFIYEGSVNISVKENETDSNKDKLVVKIEKSEYFGELAILQDESVRTATAMAQENCYLLGLFKPDVERMLRERPVVAAKLLQSVAQIVASRLYSITKEVHNMKTKIKTLRSRRE